MTGAGGPKHLGGSATRLFLSVEFPWGRASDSRGGSPRALGGVFDPFEGYVVLPDGNALDVRHGGGARGFDRLVLRRGREVLPAERPSLTPD